LAKADGSSTAAETPEGVYPVLTSFNYSSDPSTSILSTPLPEGHIYRINTGAPLPLGADAVVMVEDTELVSTHEDNSKEEREVRLLAAVPKGENVRLPGSDVKAGEKVLEKGTRISEVGGEIGTLAFVGRKRAKVFRKPKVAIMSTGNEITDLSAPAGKADLPVIHDSNRPSLNTAISSHGFAVQDLGIIPDDESAHIAALQKGMTEADVIVTTGGTSMGESDLLKPVIERNLHGTIHFGRVAMKPGKPTTFASIPGGGAGGNSKATLIFALPGNPASALVTFHLFVLPCLRKMSGFASSEWHLPKMNVSIDTTMRLDPRPEFHRVWITPSSKPPYLTAKSTGGQRSSRTVSLAGANGLVCLPSSKESDKKEFGKCEIVNAILIGRLG
jgi:gephyrin